MRSRARRMLPPPPRARLCPRWKPAWLPRRTSRTKPWSQQIRRRPMRKRPSRQGRRHKSPRPVPPQRFPISDRLRRESEPSSKSLLRLNRHSPRRRRISARNKIARRRRLGKTPPRQRFPISDRLRRESEPSSKSLLRLNRHSPRRRRISARNKIARRRRLGKTPPRQRFPISDRLRRESEPSSKSSLRLNRHSPRRRRISARNKIARRRRLGKTPPRQRFPISDRLRRESEPSSKSSLRLNRHSPRRRRISARNKIARRRRLGKTPPRQRFPISDRLRRESEPSSKSSLRLNRHSPRRRRISARNKIARRRRLGKTPPRQRFPISDRLRRESEPSSKSLLRLNRHSPRRRRISARNKIARRRRLGKTPPRQQFPISDRLRRESEPSSKSLLRLNRHSPRRRRISARNKI